MESAGIAGFEKYGLAGLVIAALFALLWFIVKEHKAERDQWIDAYKSNTDVIRQLSLKQCGFELRKKISE